MLGWVGDGVGMGWSGWEVSFLASEVCWNGQEMSWGESEMCWDGSGMVLEWVGDALE